MPQSRRASAATTSIANNILVRREPGAGSSGEIICVLALVSIAVAGSAGEGGSTSSLQRRTDLRQRLVYFLVCEGALGGAEGEGQSQALCPFRQGGTLVNVGKLKAIQHGNTHIFDPFFHGG